MRYVIIKYIKYRGGCADRLARFLMTPDDQVRKDRTMKEAVDPKAVGPFPLGVAELVARLRYSCDGPWKVLSEEEWKEGVSEEEWQEWIIKKEQLVALRENKKEELE